MQDTENGPAVDIARVRELFRNVTGYVQAIHASNADRDIAELWKLEDALLSRPIPGVTRNAGYTVRAVMPDGEAWWVAAEDPARGDWVTWHCAAGTGDFEGKLGYAWGNYFGSSDHAANRQRALADLAARAGTTRTMAVRIADEITRYHRPPLTPAEREDKRTASRLRKWAGQ
jgi:hypothetical protein